MSYRQPEQEKKSDPEQKPSQEKTRESSDVCLLWVILLFLAGIGFGIWQAVQSFSSGQFLWGIGWASLSVVLGGGTWIMIYYRLIHKNEIRCFFCSEWIKEDVRYCTECGHSLNIVPSSLTCPSCSEVVDKNNKFCPSCGKNLKLAPSTPVLESSIPVAASSLTLTQKNECPSCHEKTYPGEAFCGSCGHLLISTSTQTQLGP